MVNKRSKTLLSLAVFSIVLIAVLAVVLIDRTGTANFYDETKVVPINRQIASISTASQAKDLQPGQVVIERFAPSGPAVENQKTQHQRMSSGISDAGLQSTQGLVSGSGQRLLAAQNGPDKTAPIPESKKTEVFRLSGGTRLTPSSQDLPPQNRDNMSADQATEELFRDSAALFAAPSSSEDANNARQPGHNRTKTAVVAPRPQPERDRFPEVASNPVKKVTDARVSTLSVDVDTASYAFVRSELTHGRRPRPEAVRPEELINYFDYDYPVPEDSDVPFSTNVSVIETPWNANTKLLQIGLQGYSVPLEQLPPQNLVFLIDTSGSMAATKKMPLLQQAFRLLLSSLRSEDRVAIVTYAGRAALSLQPTSADDKKTIVRAINALQSGGGTAGHAGLQGAYEIAEKMRDDGGDTRIILATDGDFNVGLSNSEELKRYISDQRKRGISLSVLGFGRGNYNDTLMQTLAQNGNGVAAYIDTLAEARKVLVDQVVSSIVMIAQDVKIQVEFNPATIAEYRLIGYETRALKREDFNNDKVDAGDIGAGHTVTALYEITPVGSPAVRLDDLRYGPASPQAIPAAAGEFADELAFVKLRYKLPGENRSHLITTPVTDNTAGIPESEALFAASVASFGQLLQGADYLGDWSVGDAEKLATANLGNDPHGYRAEYLSLLRLAAFAEH